ncbi:sulfatase-like hydrolase/transferase [uncultured Cohaesibacter sp.]|uniref:sulfatase-like hydrolase/transferase n=1 Tax=uncultured Cohaesibacter sp. TaxID=1002546 RepID=UPI00292E546C|nr:sulfatase-like hydrolase/transferase [uncultured Cohaesibacter sp.]
MTRPNIILITADQWRGDCLGSMGHPTVKTPNLDALAADAVAFRNHYCTTAPCSPSRASLYTGLYQMNHRVVQNGAPLADRFDNIAKAGRRAGYRPTLFGYTDTALDPAGRDPSDPALTTYEGILPGMEAGQLLLEDYKPWVSWLKERGHSIEDRTQLHIPEMEAGERVSLKAPFFSKDETQAAFLINKMENWLDEREGEDNPFFAHLSFIAPHPPFIVPEPYNGMYDPKANGPAYQRHNSAEEEMAADPFSEMLMKTIGVNGFLTYDAEGNYGSNDLVKDLSADDIDRIRAIYFGMMSEVDDCIGQLINSLKRRGLWENTLFIFTADHAEMMGDHWMMGKGGFHKSSYHIPLIIRAPGGGRGETVEAFTSSADVLPTVLEILGLEATNALDGTSLMEHVDGNPVSGWRDAAFYEFDFRGLRERYPELKARMRQEECSLAVLRDEKFHYVHIPGFPALLYDLEKDPDCLANVAEEEAYLRTRLDYAEKLLAVRARHLDETLARYLFTPEGMIATD